MEINRCFGCMAQITGYPCTHCGYDPQKQKVQTYALRPGTILNGKYLVGKVLGQGGFGITYVGLDLALERKVAIKEYFPSGQVSRHPSTGNLLQWYTTEQARTAKTSGREMFLKEARKMTRVDSIPQVVRVCDLFQENDTAYIVMDFVEGETLKERLKKTGPLSWEQVREIFLPVMEAMERIHDAGLIHRDLSPDNLMLQPDGGVKILDLGAAKDLNLNHGASSMQVAKGGFSPLEQYTQRGGSGTWTDVYALAATMYYTLTGVLPPAAVDRMEEDTIRWDLPQLTELPRSVIEALRNALAVSPKKRTQTMAQFRKPLMTKEKPAVSKPKNRPDIGSVRGTAKAGVSRKPTQTKIQLGDQMPGEKGVVSTPKLRPAVLAALIAVSVLLGGVVGYSIFEQKNKVSAEGISNTSQTVAVGDMMTLGTYEQDGDTRNGTEDLEWLVLDIQDGKALLLSRYALYVSSRERTTWDKSELRNSLNDTFFQTAFSQKERECIVSSQIDTNGKGYNTNDKVFLLSSVEAGEYFAEEISRKCKPTPYARDQGAFLGEGFCWWWLRDADETNAYAECVHPSGKCIVANTQANGIGVRPAIWISLQE